MQIRPSRLILGGHSLTQLNISQCKELLSFASDNGIREIDCAPSYPGVEQLLSKIGPLKSKFKINSKVGLPNQEGFDRGQILKEAQGSLLSLGIDSFDTLFIHSAPFSQFNDFVFEEMLKLKQMGITKFIGFSSNSNVNDLTSVICTDFFDRFQITLNMIDQTNLSICKGISSEKIYLKRIFASGVLNETFFSHMKLMVKRISGLTDRFDTNSYLFRYQDQFGINPFQGNMYLKFLNFALRQGPKSKLIIGTKNINHLNQILKYESEFDEKLIAKSDYNCNKFLQSERRYSWAPRD